MYLKVDTATPVANNQILSAHLTNTLNMMDVAGVRTPATNPADFQNRQRIDEANALTRNIGGRDVSMNQPQVRTGQFAGIGIFAGLLVVGLIVASSAKGAS